MKLYDKVKQILETYPETRGSDKMLIWQIAKDKNMVSVDDRWIRKDNFMNLPAFESITRARRKVQENHPSLQANKTVQNARDKKEETKGMFAYHEVF